MTAVLPQTERIPQMPDDTDFKIGMQALLRGDLFVQAEFGHDNKNTIWMSQWATAIRIANLIDLSVTLLAIHLEGSRVTQEAIEVARVGARDQKKHVEGYMRMPQRKDLDPALTRLGSKIDRMLLMASELLLSTIDLYELPEKLKIRRDFVEETERRRAARLERRRQRQASAATTMAPPPVPADKREKEFRPPPCDKCGKRPRVSGLLCEPCAKWVASR